MTIKEFLRNIQAQHTRIRIIENQIRSLQGFAEYKTPVPDLIGGSPGSLDPHSRESLIAKIIDMKNELTKMKLEYLKDIEKATRMILDIKQQNT